MEILKNVGVKVHISRVRNEIGKCYDSGCPYFPSAFANLGGLNRHIYIKICPEMTTRCENKTWPEFWQDMCRNNNNTDDPIVRGSANND